MVSDMKNEKLLIANRGEIAVRIIRTAQRLGLKTVAVYTKSDATSPHVQLADESHPLLPHENDHVANSRGYLDIEAIISICLKTRATLLHPGYGFLSENAEFAVAVLGAGVTWLGPRPDVIRTMGLKHEARQLALKANVPVVPGSVGTLDSVEDALEEASRVGFPIMLKATAGGGGMSLVVCRSQDGLSKEFPVARQRALSLFRNQEIFLERYIESCRHIEVQIFGDGLGQVIHFGERECSVQRRHQKIIEESPSPYLLRYPDLRRKLWDAAVGLAKGIQYSSAGTCEFILDDTTGEFFFIEMNTRLQVEHGVTEAIRPGLDLVELMILQGLAERDPTRELDVNKFKKDFASESTSNLHAVEVRVYCENVLLDFRPSPGLLQYVSFPEYDWVRVDTWVRSGTLITSFFDPLVSKIITVGEGREEAVQRMIQYLNECNVHGPPNNLHYLSSICQSQAFREVTCTTTFLSSFKHTPQVIEVLQPGLETTIQDLPGRTIGLGIPVSGPMDPLAFQGANILVGNEPFAEALEVVLIGPKLRFHANAVVAVTGADVPVTINRGSARQWTSLLLSSGDELEVGRITGPGFRAYIAISGGFPEVPKYLGSKSTSMGLGGYQGRVLSHGDQLFVKPASARAEGALYPLPPPSPYTSHWTIHCLHGPHDDEEFILPSGIQVFYQAHWTVSPSSNRMGVRLQGPKIQWARENGGEGGSHPSNIHDNGYALGSVNINGDTPVILTQEGPSMGGYLCLTTICSSDLWKVGQLHPGDTLQFKPVDLSTGALLTECNNLWLEDVKRFTKLRGQEPMPARAAIEVPACSRPDPKLHVIYPVDDRPQVVFRQAGDRHILIEYGRLKLDLNMRARIHKFETEVMGRQMPGIQGFAPCIRSTMCEFDPSTISQEDVINVLTDVENSLPSTIEESSFPSRKISLPIVLDDSWSREALKRYIQAQRDKAVYLPSNIEYLAKNNGLRDAAHALSTLIKSDWIVLGVGFYLACPFLVPIDPRCRLVATKMNPSRTFTPRGAIGMAGLVGAIYPIESPGGYQLFGRTLPGWNAWGLGSEFSAKQPWLFRPFDIISFEPIDESDYAEVERQFDAGQYRFKIEPHEFSMAEYSKFIDGIAAETDEFMRRRTESVARQEEEEKKLLKEWEDSRKAEARLVDDKVLDESGGSSTIQSFMTASVWKIKVSVGDEITSATEPVVILEAMKTEVNIEAGEQNIGKRVKGFGKGVQEGALVNAGDTLVLLE